MPTKKELEVVINVLQDFIKDIGLEEVFGKAVLTNTYDIIEVKQIIDNIVENIELEEEEKKKEESNQEETNKEETNKEETNKEEVVFKGAD